MCTGLLLVNHKSFVNDFGELYSVDSEGLEAQSWGERQRKEEQKEERKAKRRRVKFKFHSHGRMDDQIS